MFRSALLLLLALPCLAMAQSPAAGNYFWKNEIILQGCDLSGNNISYKVTSLVSQKFRVINLGTDSSIIRIMNYELPKVLEKATQTTSSNKDDGSGSDAAATALANTARANFFKYNFSGTPDDYKALASGSSNRTNLQQYQRYFKVSNVVIDSSATYYTRIGGSLATGVLNYPFKFRPQAGKSDFSGAFNIGAALGYRWPHKSYREFTWLLLGSYGISTISLDSSTVRQNGAGLTTANDFTALSMSAGLMVEYNKVQAGVFVGVDNLSRGTHREYEWIYQGKPWISIGFGYSIFSTETDKGSTNEGQGSE